MLRGNAGHLQGPESSNLASGRGYDMLHGADGRHAAEGQVEVVLDLFVTKFQRSTDKFFADALQLRILTGFFYRGSGLAGGRGFRAGSDQAPPSVGDNLADGAALVEQDSNPTQNLEVFGGVESMSRWSPHR